MQEVLMYSSDNKIKTQIVVFLSNTALLSAAFFTLLTLTAYLIVWTTNLGSFYNHDFLTVVDGMRGWTDISDGTVIFRRVLRACIIGMVSSCLSALVKKSDGEDSWCRNCREYWTFAAPPSSAV